MEKGAWHTILKKTVPELNTELSKQKVKLQYDISSDKPTVTGDGANIWVRAEAGSFDLKFQNKSDKGQIDANGLHGETHLWREEDSKTKKQEMVKAYVILPRHPLIGDARKRAAGEPILKVIMAHELIHAAGLDNDEHTDDDIFVGVQNADQGNTPADDHLRIRFTGKDILMPPIFLSQTVKKLQAIW
jgi:hypothetical protein